MLQYCPLILFIAGALPIFGQGDSAERWNIHFQATSIGQHHGWFSSPYQGDNSLPGHPESRVSITATIFLTWRVNSWTELMVDPELAGGKGFGTVTGIAGFTNGEIPRVASATPTLYPARVYVRNTWGLGGGNEMVEAGQNQLGGPVPARRFTLITGKFALTDFFDNNRYSHDPRRQFMNWSLMSNGAWDYPADTRGYTIGVVEELTLRRWSLRAASAMEPTEANGPTFDTRVAQNLGSVVEWEGRDQPLGHPGALRLLGYLNRERAGTFREALLSDGTTDLAATRRPGTKKVRIRCESGTGDHARSRRLRALRLERWQDRDLGVHANRPFGVRRRRRAGKALAPSRRYRWRGRSAQLSFGRRPPLPGRRRHGLHHRRRASPLRAGIDSRSLLFLAGIEAVDIDP